MEPLLPDTCMLMLVDPRQGGRGGARNMLPPAGAIGPTVATTAYRYCGHKSLPPNWYRSRAKYISTNYCCHLFIISLYYFNNLNVKRPRSFLQQRFFLPFFLFLAWWPPLLFLVRNFYFLQQVTKKYMKKQRRPPSKKKTIGKNISPRKGKSFH
jgi:hypothetical protein